MVEAAQAAVAAGQLGAAVGYQRRLVAPAAVAAVEMLVVVEVVGGDDVVDRATREGADACDEEGVPQMLRYGGDGEDYGDGVGAAVVAGAPAMEEVSVVEADVEAGVEVDGDGDDDAVNAVGVVTGDAVVAVVFDAVGADGGGVDAEHDHVA